MSKASGTTRMKRPNKSKFVRDEFLEDNFLSRNEDVNAWLRNSIFYGDKLLDDKEIKETIDYVDRAFEHYQQEDKGTLFRGVAFRTKKELNDFIDTNIVFTDGIYKDKGFAFTTTKEVNDAYKGKFGVEFEYEGAKGLPHKVFDKGYHDDVLIINRNIPFKVVSVTPVGEGYRIKLKKM